MGKVCMVFCSECKSDKIDSGFDTPSTLRCCECGNEKEFKVGKVDYKDNMNYEEIIIQAKKDANIE